MQMFRLKIKGYLTGTIKLKDRTEKGPLTFSCSENNQGLLEKINKGRKLKQINCKN